MTNTEAAHRRPAGTPTASRRGKELAACRRCLRTLSRELRGGGRLYPDGWLVGMVDASSLWLERGVRVKIGGSENNEEGGPTTGTVPLTAYMHSEEDLKVLEVFFNSGAYGESEALDPNWLRSIGWDGVVEWLRVCEACYTVCRAAGGF